MFRVGIGFDAHRFAAERKLMLGGVQIKNDIGLWGHSDADVLLHALGDALLGAAGLGDMGLHFPDSDTLWKDAPSKVFIQKILQELAENNWMVVNADMIVIAQTPRIDNHRLEICRSVAEMLGLPETSVNLKATTTDHMGFVGRKEGIAAQAIVLLERKA